MTKAFGFNGARTHQKVEDPRWLYWRDKLGLLVWGEMANAYDVYHDRYVARFVNEWMEAMARDYHHPSIVGWVPINESWGAMRALLDPTEQHHLRSLYYLTKSLDASRPVVDNDGWEHTDATDLFTLHDYARTGAELTDKYQHLTTDRSRIPRNGRRQGVGVSGHRADGRGAGRADRRSGEGAPREHRVRRLLRHAAHRRRAGINGLMTYDRKPKVAPDVFRKVFAQ
jgi:hypothetical protein